ncbi:Uncharacterised protein [Klebsiella quasipneumoniae]|nr:Uncharacterised protein [Klebsiella quasipneumoniae]
MTLTQLHAVSTTTGAGEVPTQLPINIVITHTLNALFNITSPFRGFCFTFCHSNTGGCFLFGMVLLGFGFCLACSACMTDAERASDRTQDDNHQPSNNFNIHC